MDQIETAMRHYDAEVIEALHHLEAQVDKAGMTALHATWAAYKDFYHLNAEIVDLSRQNSNVRSFALSLGQKRKVTAQCQDALAALQEAVREGMNSKATK